MRRFLSIDATAEMLGLSRDFIEARLREFAAIKAGRVYRIPEDGIEEWIKANTVSPDPPRPLRALRVSVFTAADLRRAALKGVGR